MTDFFKTIELWGETVPFRIPEDAEQKEHFTEDKGDGINRLTDVSQPSMTWFPASGREPHPAVLVCPGGGYGILAWNHEGRDICMMLNQIGFSAFLLKYRCPNRRAAAHADAARAMRLIRANAESFGIRADRVGAIGFPPELILRRQLPLRPMPCRIRRSMTRMPKAIVRISPR